MNSKKQWKCVFLFNYTVRICAVGLCVWLRHFVHIGEVSMYITVMNMVYVPVNSKVNYLCH